MKNIIRIIVVVCACGWQQTSAQLLTTYVGSGGFSGIPPAPCGTGTIDVSAANLCILPLMLGLAR